MNDCRSNLITAKAWPGDRIIIDNPNKSDKTVAHVIAVIITSNGVTYQVGRFDDDDELYEMQLQDWQFVVVERMQDYHE